MKLKVKIRKLVKDVFAGSSQSVRKAYKGLELYEFKDYNPESDPILSIDLRTSLKRGKWTVKLMEAEKSFTGLFLLDVSRSEGVATGIITKKQLAVDFMEAISSALIEKDGRVGAILFADKVVHFTRPRFGPQSAKKLISIAREYQPAVDENRNETLLSPALSFVERNRDISAPSLIFIISDGIFGQNDEYKEQLARLSKKHDILSLVIRDRSDNNIPFPTLGCVNFRDVESGQLVLGDRIENDSRFSDTCRQFGIATETFLSDETEAKQWQKIADLFARHAKRRG